MAVGGSWVVELRPSATGAGSSRAVRLPSGHRRRRSWARDRWPGAAEVARAAESKVLGLTPELAGPWSTEIVRRPIEACTLALLETLHADADADDVRVPEIVLAGNRDLVHRGVPLDRMQRAIWTSHAYAHQQLLTFMERHAGAALLSSEVRRVTELSFAFAEALTSRLTADFVAERDAWLDSVPALRRQVVDDLVAGRRPAVKNPGQILRLDLGRCIVPAVVWTNPDEPDEAAPADTARVAAALAATSGAAGSLVVPITRSTAWLWLAFPESASRHLATTLREGVPAPSGVGVALGPARTGTNGFRQSHIAAVRIRHLAAALATPGGPWLFDHAELDLLALLTDDPEQARWFVHDHLGRLAAGDHRTAQLRETLRLYLRFGRSRAAAAEAMHVVPNTIAYRVRQAVELVGGSLPGDLLHLRVALELCDLVSTDR